MPALFVGHGSPMNAIEENEFTRGWKEAAGHVPRPAAILCVSAHWETCGTFVTATPKPRTIHDFGGFPPSLYEVQYPAPGDPRLAGELPSMVTAAKVLPDEKWGLDHGTWSVLVRMFPEADIPVLQLSLDYRKDARYHAALAQELAGLRKRGVLVIGSGNLVHNLRLADWSGKVASYAWAEEAMARFRTLIESGDTDTLARYEQLGSAVEKAIPTPEHFIPLFYILGMGSDKDAVTFFNDRTVMGSVSMTSFRIG